jgi:hypothetical protein
MCKSKKKLTKMMNVYMFLVSIRDEKEIPYPSLPCPPPTITPITTTIMNLFRPSSYYKKKKNTDKKKPK